MSVFNRSMLLDTCRSHFSNRDIELVSVSLYSVSIYRSVVRDSCKS